jgi:hypothetical protein
MRHIDLRALRSRQHRLVAVIAVVLGTVMLFAVTSGAMAKPRQAVEVLHGAKVVARFRDARCIAHNGLFQLLIQRRTEASWGLSVDIDDFSGFHRYKIGWGLDARVSAVVVGPKAVYSNILRPPFKVDHGGYVDFARHGGVVGLAYEPAFVQQGNSTDGQDAVSFTGVLNCHYKKPHRH